MSIEPFGYFKAEPFGWTDCAETEAGAVPLYERSAIDNLEAQLAAARREAAEAQALLKRIAEQTPEKPDYWSSCGQCERNIDDAQEVLANSSNAIDAARKGGV